MALDSARIFYLRLLGGASIEADGVALAGTIAQRRRLALLALLATSPPGGVSRERLTAYLFPESDTARAHRALSDALHAVRKALGADAVLSVGDELRLNPAIVRADVSEFEAAVASADLAQAASLYRGPFLDGFFVSEAPEFERWAERERTRLAATYGSALEALARAAEGVGDVRGALPWWRKLAAHAPYDSGVAIHLMEALDRAGDRAGAIQHARVHATLLRDELDGAPHPDVMAYAERLRSEAPRAVEGPRSVSPGPASRSASDQLATVAPAAHAQPAVATPAVATPSPAASEPSAPHRAGPARRRPAWVAGVLLVVAAAALIAFRSGAVRLPGADPPIRRIAVLPLANLSGDTAQEYFADAMTDLLTTELARLNDARVISRTSVMQYKEARKPLPEIARELRVDALVAGSVVRLGDRVRVTAQLIRARNDQHIWADSFERDVRDALALQNEVARAIANRIGLELRPRPASWAAAARAVDPRAQDLYLRGLYYAGVSQRRSIEALRQALALAPDYAPAWAALARNYYFQGFFGVRPPAEAFGEMRTAAAKALEHDPTTADAYGTLALYELHWTGRWANAERLFRQALELDGNDAYVRHDFSPYLLAVRRSDESVAESKRSVELDPFNPGITACAGWHHLADRRWTETIDEAARAAMVAREFFWPRVILGWGYMQQGNLPAALAELRRADTLSRAAPFTHAALGHALAVAGQHAEARQILARLHEMSSTRYVSPYDVATVYAGLGERAEALRWLTKAQAERASFLIHAVWDPRLDPLRADPQFQSLLKQIGTRAQAG